MPTLLHQVRLPYVTNLPEDVAVNTFWTLGGTDRVAQAQAAAAAIVDFYNEEQPNSQRVSGYLSARISRLAEACTVSTYDLSDPKPRPAFHVEPFTLGSPGNNLSLPAEVAIVASFHGEPAAGIPQARRRGRIYLGPLANHAQDQPSNGPSRPSQEALTTIQNACLTLALELDGDEGRPQWIVHSRVSSNNAPVTAGWVDNEWDTQRRRGLKPSARSIWNMNI